MRMTLWLLVAIAGMVGMTVALFEERFGMAFLLAVVSLFSSHLAGLAKRAREKASPHVNRSTSVVQRSFLTKFSRSSGEPRPKSASFIGV